MGVITFPGGCSKVSIIGVLEVSEKEALCFLSRVLRLPSLLDTVYSLNLYNGFSARVELLTNFGTTLECCSFFFLPTLQGREESYNSYLTTRAALFRLFFFLYKYQIKYRRVLTSAASLDERWLSYRIPVDIEPPILLISS